MSRRGYRRTMVVDQHGAEARLADFLVRSKKRTPKNTPHVEVGAATLDKKNVLCRSLGKEKKSIVCSGVVCAAAPTTSDSPFCNEMAAVMEQTRESGQGFYGRGKAPIVAPVPFSLLSVPRCPLGGRTSLAQWSVIEFPVAPATTRDASCFFGSLDRKWDAANFLPHLVLPCLWHAAISPFSSKPGLP